MEDINVRSVRYPVAIDQKFEKIALKLGRTKREVFIQMVDYFYKRGRNEEHSKKMGQFDRVAFKQCGEDLFDSLFEFDRQLRETMAYANVKKNGNLHERLQMETLELEIILPSNSLPTDESLIYPATNNEKSFNELSEPIHINITEDVNDEAVYGRDRQRNKPRGR